MQTILTSSAPGLRSVRTLWAQYKELSKFRLTTMVVITTAVGYAMAMHLRVVGWTFAWTLLGTALLGAGASAFNQWIEMGRDARMQRTCRRPMPTGAISEGHASIFATIASVLGAALLWELVNPLTAVLGILNLVIYVLFYTPMKPRSSLNTLVGALCGALPPMMGWSAATDDLGLGAWLLGAILFVWQIPHFLALAWLYRDDYARGGYCMLPLQDPDGSLTCRAILLYSLTLLPLGLAVTLCGLAGWTFGVASLVLGYGMIHLALKLRQDRSRDNARRLFLASVIYLPLLLILMVANCR